MHRFKLHLANELCKPVMNVRRIEMLSLVNISFGSAQTVNSTNDLCWLNIINFTALDLLGNRQGKQAMGSIGTCEKLVWAQQVWAQLDYGLSIKELTKHGQSHWRSSIDLGSQIFALQTWAQQSLAQYMVSTIIS